eukprot:scaffold3043_cov121-Cylindrotheca_fusiformis.AAC.7
MVQQTGITVTTLCISCCFTSSERVRQPLHKVLDDVLEYIHTSITSSYNATRQVQQCWPSSFRDLASIARTADLVAV